MAEVRGVDAGVVVVAGWRLEEYLLLGEGALDGAHAEKRQGSRDSRRKTPSKVRGCSEKP